MVACGGGGGTPGTTLGPIIPAPLAAPQIWICTPSASMAAEAVFGFVSVVRMALANPSACSCEPPTVTFRAGTAARTLSVGNGTPIMPVEDGMTSSKMQPKVSATATQVETQPSIPG